jgi:Protein of unknown function (DUF1759)
MADITKVKALIKQRGHAKARLTRHKTFINEFELSKPSKPISLLSVRVSTIDDCWHEFDRIQTQLEELLADDESYDEVVGERIEFEEEYFELKARIHDLVASQTPSSPHFDSSHCASTSTNNSIRLPTIELPTFGGAYEEWQQYRDIFSSLIDSNQSLSKIQKFHYLKASLQGDASKVIHSLEISSVNYDTAWELLKSRFADPKIIINKHIQALFELPRLQCETIDSLRPLADNVQKHIRALANLGEPTHHWDALLLYMITNKFDPATRRLWETHAATLTEVKYINLIKFLEGRCVILEACNANNPETKERPNLRKPPHVRTPYKSLVTSSPQFNCLFCNQAHSLMQCDKFKALSIQDRIQKARDLHMCLNCLRFGHQTIQCKNPGNCRNCHKRHHTLLHLGEDPRSTPKQPPPP